MCQRERGRRDTAESGLRCLVRLRRFMEPPTHELPPQQLTTPPPLEQRDPPESTQDPLKQDSTPLQQESRPLQFDSTLLKQEEQVNQTKLFLSNILFLSQCMFGRRLHATCSS